ncbi:ClpX C4-type zinc finger protein [Rhodopseudomonas parapalustris]
MADAEFYCSFCGKSSREAEVMLAGVWPSFICETCVADAGEQITRIIADRRSEADLVREALHCAFCKPEPLTAGDIAKD